MKKYITIITFILILSLSSIVFASVEVPEYIKVKVSDGTVLEIDLDTYLYSVVQSEIGVNYRAMDMAESEPVPMESLKAQAVASRSYAVYKILSTDEDAEYHVTSTTSDQVYKNVTVNERVKAAVDETSGQVITYDDKVACAYFFSTSGGHTEAPENVWSAAIDYLKGVDDPYEINAQNKSSWTATYTISDLQAKFPEIGEIQDIQIVRRSENDRVIELKIVGSRSSKILLKNGIRTALGTTKLRSQWFEVEKDGNQYVFTGRGYGHGVGMSQNGAIGMGAEGFTYDEILKWYYTDVEIFGFDEEDNEKNEDEEIYGEKNEEVLADYYGEREELETPLLDSLVEVVSTNWLLETLKTK